jgi:hypothetical protein
MRAVCKRRHYDGVRLWNVGDSIDVPDDEALDEGMWSLPVRAVAEEAAAKPEKGGHAEPSGPDKKKADVQGTD